MIFSLLLFGGDAIGMVILDTIMNLLVIIINGYYVFNKLNVKFKMHSFELLFVKEIFSYSVWIFVFGLVQMFQWKSGHIILGINFDTVTVAIFSVGIMLGTYYGAFASAINGVVLPRATQMIVNNESGQLLTEMMIKIGRVIMIILGFILISFILIGEEFILLWVGKTYEDSFMIALLIMIVSTVPLVQGFGNSILEANNKIKSKAILNLITMLLGVFAGFNISKEYGSVGMIICIVSALLVNSIITNIYFIKIFDFKIVLFFKKTFLSIILLLVLMIFVGSGINKLTTEISWLSLLLKGFILVIMYAGLSFLIVLNKDEKQIIHNYIKKN